MGDFLFRPRADIQVPETYESVLALKRFPVTFTDRRTTAAENGVWPKTMPCFETCNCECDQPSVGHTQFNKTLASELRLEINLHTLCHSNIGWFLDKSQTDHHLGDWGLQGKSGIYLLWHKDDYCDQHDAFHMRCMYVGKGSIGRRFVAHYLKKDFSEEAIVYWSYFPTSNRVAKYLEQLLLDTFSLPLNRAENIGKERLCSHYSQAEADFGS